MAALRCLRSDVNQADTERSRQGEFLRPCRRRYFIDHVRKSLGVSERQAFRVMGQHRSTQRRIPRGRQDENRIVADMVKPARQHGRYGYRRIAALLRQAG